MARFEPPYHFDDNNCRWLIISEAEATELRDALGQAADEQLRRLADGTCLKLALRGKDPNCPKAQRQREKIAAIRQAKEKRSRK